MTDRDETAGAPFDDELTHSHAPTSRAAATIGPYRLLQQVGEGGMGVVWLAEQIRPVRRQVALKVIKLGMDTAQVVARFEAERQALAIMEHPAVARVFDAGVTPQGRPYFAMEYVRGEPITTYCQRHRLPTSERINLFLQVCDGVQHAHQKGIIHRDLKPSNVLVTMQDNHAVPKIIDFGLAKATTQHLTERTLFTELGVLIGTPEYMSPEQAEMTGLDIDTRTDVYALGVILYELLTGVLPFEGKSLREKGLDEIRRIIREVDPPRPSVRVTTLAAPAPPAQSLRRDVARLASQLRGDLDCITMKALEKDRTRRYGSVPDLAADLRRHLDNLPVLASPPSTVYRLSRFMRRHRVGVAAAATLVVLLFAFAATMAFQARRIAQQRDRALAAERQSIQEAELARQVSSFLVDLFKVSDPSEARGNRITAREILDKGSTRITQELKDHPAVQGRLMATMGRVYTSLGLYDQARLLLQDALAIRRRTLGEQHLEVAESLDDLGSLQYEIGNLGEAERLLRDALALRRRTLGDEHLDTANTENHLAMALRRKETPEANAEVEQLYRSALAARRKVLGADDRAIAESLNDLGLLFSQNKRDYAAAEPLFREALEINRRAFGNDHLEVSITLNNLALLLRDTGRYTEAESLLREALVIDRHVLGEEHPAVGVVFNNLANVLERKGDLPGAESMYRDALALRRKAFPNEPDGHWEVATIKSLLGGCLTAARRYADAEPLLLESYPVIKGNFGDAHPRTQVALKRLVDLYDAWGKSAKVAEYRAMLVQPSR
jgi:eukaryotic-like serine/threonine-protein kinase